MKTGIVEIGTEAFVKAQKCQKIIDELIKKYEKLKEYNLEICQECGFPQDFHKLFTKHFNPNVGKTR